MKIFIFLFCLLVAVLALPASAENQGGIVRSDSVLIEDQNEDLVGAESRRYRNRGGGDGSYYGGRGGRGGSYYGKGRGYSRGGY